MTLPTGHWRAVLTGTTIAKGSSAVHLNSIIAGDTVYSIPDGAVSSTPICALDTVTDTSFTITDVATGQYRWGKSVLADNGHIYAPPRFPSGILKLDTSTNTASLIPVGVSGADRWEGEFVKSPVTGILWAPPRFESRVLRVDPATDTVSFVELGLGGGPGYHGGGFDTAGNFYIPPGTTAVTSKVTPGGTVTAVAGATVDGSTASKYIGRGVLAPNGCLYFAPFKGIQVLKVDPAGNSGAGAASLIGASPLSAGYGLGVDKFYQGFAHGTGIYFPGWGSAIAFLKIDTLTDTVSILPTGTGGWGDGVAYDANSYICPSRASADSVLRFWPATDTFALYSTPINTSTYRNLVRAPNGAFYGIATSNSSSTKISRVTNTDLRLLWCKNGVGAFQEWYAGLCPQGATGDLEGAFADDQIFAALRTTTATNYRSKRATTSLTTGVWYHVAQVATATTVDLYINGVNVGVAPTAGSGTRSGDLAAPLSVGGFLNTPRSSHRGRMALVSFIPSALSGPQVFAHYSGRADMSGYVDAVTADLVAGSSFWQMQETSGLIQDSTAAARHATAAVGGPVYAQSGPMVGANSIAFDGDSLFSIPDDASFSSTDFTMEGWVLFTAVGGAVAHTGSMSG